MNTLTALLRESFSTHDRSRIDWALVQAGIVLELARQSHLKPEALDKTEQQSQLLAPGLADEIGLVTDPDTFIESVARLIPTHAEYPAFYMLCRRWECVLGVRHAASGLADAAAQANLGIARECLFVMLDCSPELISKSLDADERGRVLDACRTVVELPFDGAPYFPTIREIARDLLERLRSL